MTADLERIVKDALINLTPVWSDDGRLCLAVPVRYPSGALVSLDVSAGEREAIITDRSLGLFEAEMCGADGGFPACAKRAAANAGVRFDGHSLFAIEVPLDRLPGGIVAVANASASAAAEAIRTDSLRRAEGQNDAIQRRLREAFPGVHVEKQMVIAGARAEWDAHNVVRLGDRFAVFEAVSPHQQSIAAKFTMFSDLSKRADLSLAAVVDRASDLSGKGTMIFDVARVIEAGAPPTEYRQLIAA